MTGRLLLIFIAAHLGSFAAETNHVARAAETTHAAPSNSFEAFRIIAERNIFNPNRSARGARRNDDGGGRSPRGESFSLVGTMLYENGEYAFFDSSSSSYRKALKPGDTIAGYKVNAVSPGGVKLEKNEKIVEVSVGQQLRRQEEGEWTVSGKAAVEEPKAAQSASSSSDDEDEAVKRLMKKREEEMNK